MMAVALLVLGPMGLLAGYQIHHEVETSRQNLEQIALSIARVNAAEISRSIAQTESLLGTLATNPGIRALDPKRCGHWFEHFKEVYPQHSNLLTKDINGYPVCSALPIPPGTKINLAYYLNEVQHKNGFGIGVPNQGALSKRWVVPLDFPIRDDAGNIVGTVSAPLDLLDFNPFVGTDAFLGLPKGTTATLFAPDMTMLARSLDPEQWIGSRRVQVPELVALVTGRTETARFVSKLDQIERVHGAAKVPGTAWTTLASIPTAPFDAELQTRIRMLVAGYGVAAAVLLGLIYGMVGRPAGSSPVGADPGASNSTDAVDRRLQSGHGRLGSQLIFLAILFGTLGLFGYLFRSSYQSTRAQALVGANNVSEVLASTIQTTLERAQSDLLVFVPQITADDLAGRVSDIRRADIESRMEAHLRSFAAVSNYRVFDAAGRSLFGAGSANAHVAITVADREWFTQLRDDPNRDFVLSQVVVGQGTRRQTVILGVAIRDGDRHFIGAINAAINLSYFQNLIDNLDIGPNGLVAVRRTDDFTLMLRRPELVEQINEPAKPGGLADIIQSDRLSGEGEFRSTVDGISRLFAFRTLSHYPLSVIVGTSADDYFSSWRNQTALSGLAALALSAALLMMFWQRVIVQRHLEASQRQLSAEVGRFKAVLTAASDGIHVLDADGDVVEASDSFCRMLGYAREEIIGMNVSRWDAHFAPDALKGVVTSALAANGQVFVETRHRRKDGSTYEVEVTAYPFALGDQRVIFCSSRDISERKTAELALRESEERFRSLVEGTTDWVWETDADHRFTWISGSLERLFGIPTASIIGRRRWDLASPERNIEASRWEAYMADLGEHRSFRDFRYWLKTADGQARWVSVSGSPRFDESGKFLGYRGSGADITEKAAQSTRIRLLSTVVEQSPVSVVITDPDGTIRYANGHFSTVSGYQPAEVIGQNPRLFASGETPAETYRDMWATITGGKRWVGELNNRRKDGSLHWEMMIIAPVRDEMGQIAHYVAIKEDVSERHALQDKLRQTNAELEQFAYVASHDLRQPLRMVTSYLGLIEKRLGPQLSDDIKTFMDYAIGGARRMDRLILDLLEYSRTGKTGTPVPVALGEVLDVAKVNLTVAIREAEAEVSIAEDMPTVLGDAGELTRLFQNLIGNAVKYRAPERRPVVTVACRRQERDWVVSVSDNGIGIAPEDQERAFRIFQRLVPQGDYEGTGIGLAVCKKIVEHHGGRIWIESEVGVGSTFFVSIPTTTA